jgi:hypothetical protein
LRSYLDIGTIIRVLTKISDFLGWCKSQQFIHRRQYDGIMIILNGCLQSARKAGQQKTVERLEEEAQNQPAPTTTTLRQSFRRNPIHFLYEMGCQLMVLLTVKNACRVSVLRNLRLIDVDRAERHDENGKTRYTISVSRHKTSSGKVTFLV